ncbi:hypothetical protein CLOP_g23528 [Closterium sp. NIES-67]|nr:hypothetical protein CLOP_g23528 [Closterium sp. NIES-67]
MASSRAFSLYSSIPSADANHSSRIHPLTDDPPSASKQKRFDTCFGGPPDTPPDGPPSASKQKHPPRRRSILRRMGAAVDFGINYVFSGLARVVATHPIAVLALMIGLGVLMACGVFKMTVETNIEELYTPQGNIAFQNRDYVDSLYGYEALDVKVFVVSKGNTNRTLLTKPALLALLDVYELITSVNATYNGSTFNYADPRICYRPGGQNTPCQVVSVLDYWGYSRAAIQRDKDIMTTLNNPFVLTRYGQPVPQDWVVGVQTKDPETGEIAEAKAFLLTMFVQNNKGCSGSSCKDYYVDEWQKAIDAPVRAFSSDEIDVYLLSYWGQQAASDSAITADVNLYFASAFLLLAYSLLILFRRHPVHSHCYLALVNMASITLAVLGSYGVCSLCGLKFSLVTQSLALLLLGLGTDDMLVTMAAHDETARDFPNASVVDRIVATVSRARRGVIVAALTNFVAFCTGIISELPALRDFMIYAAVGVVLVFVYQSTLYVAVLTLDLRRQRANRLDTLCCVVSAAGPTDGCCGRPYDRNKPGVDQTVIGHWLPAVILHPVGKVLVVLSTLGLLAVGIYGACNVTQNFNIDWMVPDGSYVRDVYRIRSQTFPLASGQGALPVYVYTTNPTANFTTVTNTSSGSSRPEAWVVPAAAGDAASAPMDYFKMQDELAALGVRLQEDPYVSFSPPVQSWFANYLIWLSASPHAPLLDANGRPPTSELFYEWLHEFLGSVGRRFRLDVVFDQGNSSVILSSRMFAMTRGLNNSGQQVDAMNSIRASASSAAPTLQAFAYTFPFIFVEGYAVIQPDTVLAIAIAGGVVFAIMLLLLADLTCSVLVAVMVAAIGIELVGFLYWFGLAFNSVTSITLLLAIGIAVDYSAFTAFSFLSQVGTRQERARRALNHLGVAVFNGGFFMFLSILPLALAKSFVFQTFFKMFSMIVVLGLWHGLCTLPVVLSLIGPPPFETSEEAHQLRQGTASARVADAVMPDELPGACSGSACSDMVTPVKQTVCATMPSAPAVVMMTTL